MLRILSSKIFREDLSEYALPMWAFENFDDVEMNLDMSSGTYKFCLPVSIGDFPETNVPACFSNNVKELREFVNEQKKLYHRKAFIISDFQVMDLAKVCFSGVISTYSQKGICNFFDKSTTISITLKNPILTYGQEGISPRDLPADILMTYDHISEPLCAFPKIEIKNDNFDSQLYKNVIYQAYMASVKIHNIAEMYDGSEYKEHTLFFIDDKCKVWLYEIVGEESFLGKAKCDMNMLKDELSLIKNVGIMSEEKQESCFKENNKLCRRRVLN